MFSLAFLWLPHPFPLLDSYTQADSTAEELHVWEGPYEGNQTADHH